MGDNPPVVRGQPDKTSGASGTPECPLGWATVGAVLAALAAAWIAAGSTGLLAHPLRRLLTVLALGLAMALQYPLARRRRPWLLWAVVALAALLVRSPHGSLNVLAAGMVLAFLASTAEAHARRALTMACVAVAVFGVYRMAALSVRWVWLAADSAGRSLGHLADPILRLQSGGRPLPVLTALRVGATFSGLDYLVLMGVLWALWVRQGPFPRWRRAVYGLAGILAGHLVYVVGLAFVPDLLGAFPRPAAGPAWSWAGWVHKALPWNAPVLACLIHLLVAGILCRWSTWSAPWPGPARMHGPWRIAIAFAAICLPLVAVLAPGRLSLQEKKVVFYEKGFLNWLKPEHGSYGRLGSGMYGMLPVLVESLGARPLISPDLAEADLRDADLLVLIFPNEPWSDGQLERIWGYVRGGGSLLVLGEHTTADPNGASRFNEVLAPTAMQVCFDSATFAVGGWLQSYDMIAHPVCAGVVDDRNQAGVVIGASLEVGWPARPILIGRWGWSDWGDPASPRAMMGNDCWDADEKLGDLVLAAEQPLGKGRVLALGDTSGLTNGINVTTHVFTSRLLAYLAEPGAGAQGSWRQVLGCALLGLLVGLLIWRTDPAAAALAAVALAASLVASTAITHSAAQVVPDGRLRSPNNLAYIDACHHEAYSPESWRPDGIGGLALTLMRNGYLALCLPEWTAERMERAGLLISIAPSRAFSPRERAILKDFVMKGGHLILTAGADRARASRPVLADFGFRLSGSDAPGSQPRALGHFKSPYLRSEDRRVYVRFHAAWPIQCEDPEAQVVAYGVDNQPVILARPFGAGKVVVVGDTGFALNKNLEWEGGEPFEGLRENADFWRWLLTRLRDQPQWIPPSLLQTAPSSDG